MRAVFDGSYRLDQLMGLVADLVRNLQENGVHGVGSINLYFTPIKDGHKMYFFDEHGSDVDVLRFDALEVSEFVPQGAGVTMENKVGSDRDKVRNEMLFFPRLERPQSPD
jgi:hypothetical protein